MSITPLTTEPASIYAGDTISWLIALPDYPANAGWVLKYKAVSASGYFALVSTAVGADHAVSASKTDTAAYTAGTYTLTKYVESATELVTLAELPLTVKPAISGMTAAYDNRTHVKKVLDAIEAVLEGTASSDQLKVKLDDKEIQRFSIEELLKLRSTYYNYYQQELQAARLNAGQASGASRLLMRL